VNEKMCKYQTVNTDDKENPILNQINFSITTSDFTVQNVALKIGIPILSIDGIAIKGVKNYIFKCYTCNK